MRCASKAALVSTFRISAKEAEKIRQLAARASDGEKLREYVDEHCPKTAAYVRSLSSNPYRNSGWRKTVAFHAISDILGGYGMEALGPMDSGWPPYEYVNMGDSYATTLVYKRATDNLYISTMATIVEQHPHWD